MPLATLATVRAIGSLDSSAGTGVVGDAQINAAITFATKRMAMLLADYATIAAGTASQQKQDYTDAESCFAMARLPELLTSAQLAATGIVKTIDKGKETRSFVSKADRQEIRDYWEEQAFIHIRSWLATSVTDSAGEKIAATSKDKKFSVMAI